MEVWNSLKVRQWHVNPGWHSFGALSHVIAHGKHLDTTICGGTHAFVEKGVLMLLKQNINSHA